MSTKVLCVSLVLFAGMVCADAGRAASTNAPAGKRDRGPEQLKVTPDDYRRPARFKIAPETVATSPGRYTATFDDGPVNCWAAAGYEPIHYRTKMHAEGDSPNELIVSENDIAHWGVYREGLYNGAPVRVYRAINGKLQKVREDRIKAHLCSGWGGVEGIGAKLIAVAPPAEGGDSVNKFVEGMTTEAKFILPPWWREGAEQWLTVRAVDREGRMSDPATPVRLVVPAMPQHQPARPINKLMDMPKKRGSTDGAGPAAPGNVKIAVDEQRLFTITWNPSRSRDIVGYQVQISDYDPAEHKGFHLYLENSPSDPQQHVKTGDIIFIDQQHTTWNRVQRYGNRVFGSREGQDPGYLPFGNHEGPDQWELVPHPGPLPDEFRDGGETCLQLDMKTDKPRNITIARYAGTGQSWYEVLDPGKTYVVELWAKQEGMATPTIALSLNQRYQQAVDARVTVEDQWKLHRMEFQVPVRYEGNGPVGMIDLNFQGPGKLWLDNVRMYEAGTDFLDFFAADYAELAQANLEALRTHSHIKTGHGYSMAMLTNAPGAAGYRGSRSHSPHTLVSWLSIFAKAKVNPWLQIEMCMSEAEWAGFVEYLAAPYDPAKDTPQSKPWAYKRYRQGRGEPWTQAFGRIYFEISNETWNPLFRPWVFNWLKMPDHGTGRIYQSGEIYGLFQQYVIEQLRRSPYWNDELESKFEFVAGGWAIQTDVSGYGQQAVSTSPDTKHMTVAAYNGGWDEKEPPSDATDEFRFMALTQTLQVAIPRADDLVAWRDAFNQQTGRKVVLGTYEAGPGYNMDGLNGARMTRQQTENESIVMKGQVGGTATLDSFLARGERGFTLQNFFTFGRRRHHWHSHARHVSGGQAYPCWMVIGLYNRAGQGDFLKVETASVPVCDVQRTQRRLGVKDAPLVACYATGGGDRVNVFVLSRKMDNFPLQGDDGYTPVTLDLPFGAAKKITLHRMAADPRAHNLDSEEVRIETQAIPASAFRRAFPVNQTTGMDDRGLPPAASLLYVFEGVSMDAAVRQP